MLTSIVILVSITSKQYLDNYIDVDDDDNNKVIHKTSFKSLIITLILTFIVSMVSYIIMYFTMPEWIMNDITEIKDIECAGIFKKIYSCRILWTITT